MIATNCQYISQRAVNKKGWWGENLILDDHQLMPDGESCLSSRQYHVFRGWYHGGNGGHLRWLFVAALFAGVLLGECLALQINLAPRLEIDGVLSGYRFHRDEKDYFKLLELDGNSLLVGARDAVFNLSSADLSQQQKLDWPSTQEDVTKCKYNGKSEDDCHNFIRVLVRQNQGQVLVCGTNAFKPQCRTYTLEHSAATGKYRYQTHREFDGYAISPWDPRHNSTSIYLPETNELYAATVSDFTASDPLIYRKPLSEDGGTELRTPRNDLKCLNDPNFVASSADREHVYLWFREVATEYSSCGKGISARVGRVCKRDQGGPRNHGDTWTSFVKARLNCSIPGDYPFYFDELQATSAMVPGPHGDDLVYAVFTTLWEGLHASAICAYSMADVRRIFDTGQFKVQRNPSSLWLPVTKSELPSPRPGSCSPDSRSLNDNTVQFIKKNSLMDEAVPNVFTQPILIDTSLKVRYTQIAVDASVEAVNGQRYDVIFLGTDTGLIFKLVNVEANRGAGRVSTVVIEQLKLFLEPAPIRNLLVTAAGRRHFDAYKRTLRNGGLDGHARSGLGKSGPGIVDPGRNLISVTDNEVRMVPLQRCANATTCGGCVRLQDPYCAWDNVEGRCLANTNGDWSAHKNREFIQEIETGRSAKCPEGEFYDNQLFAINELWPRRSSAVSPLVYSRESMAIAVVVTLALASLLGFFIGYKFSRLRYFDQSASSSSSYTYESTNHSTLKSRLTSSDNGSPPIMNHLMDLYTNGPAHVPASHKLNDFGLMYTSLHEPVIKDQSQYNNINSDISYMLNNGTLPKDYKVKKVYL